MPSLLAKRSFPLSGRIANPGDRFTVDDDEARTLIAIGYAKVADDSETGDPPSIIAEHYGPPISAAKAKRGPDKKPRKKRGYKRRDMEAE